MNNPYFYIILHTPTNRYYAGCKINKDSDSSILMTRNGYQTTSKVVKQLICEDGLESFLIVKVKEFQTSSQALSYESRFLTKVNAAQNDCFLNRHNGGKNFLNKGGYNLSESTKNKMRKPKSQATIEKQNLAKRNRDKSIYKKMVNTRRSRYESWHSKEMVEKLSKYNKTRFDTQEKREEHSLLMKAYYKENPVTESIRELRRIQCNGEGNPMYGKKHNPATKEKMRLAWEKRKLNKLNKIITEDQSNGKV